MPSSQLHSHKVIIIGAGMCGIGCGVSLKQFGVTDFIILEKGNIICNFWKNQTYDRMSLHTPYHDLPHDGGLVYNYPSIKDKHQITDYLQKYAKKFQITQNITFYKEVIHISKDNNNSKWNLRIKDGSFYICDYLVLATSNLAKAKIPNFLASTISNFQNGNNIIHSINYKNGSKYKNLNVLVLGNGDSAFEISTDLVSYGANRVTMISPDARHILSLSDLNRSIWKLLAIGKRLGVLDFLFSKLFNMTQKHPSWNSFLYAFKTVFGVFDWFSIDLTEYGIPKPKQSVFELIMSGNLYVLDWENEDSCINLIKSGDVEYIADFVDGFEKPNVIKLRNNNDLCDYDSIICCTGYQHGLQDIFDSKLYNELFGESVLGSLWGIVPKTNGFNNQSICDNTLYFAGFLGDYSLCGGYANGYWGWEIGRNISKQQGVYNKNKELSNWNKTTIKTMMTTLIVSISSIIGVCVYFGPIIHKKYLRNRRTS